MFVPSEERLEVYQTKLSKNSIKTQPRGLAETMWGGPLALEAVSCGVPPIHCWAPVNNTSGHLKTMCRGALLNHCGADLFPRRLSLAGSHRCISGNRNATEQGTSISHRSSQSVCSFATCISVLFRLR